MVGFDALQLCGELLGLLLGGEEAGGVNAACTHRIAAPQGLGHPCRAKSEPHLHSLRPTLVDLFFHSLVCHASSLPLAAALLARSPCSLTLLLDPVAGCSTRLAIPGRS